MNEHIITEKLERMWKESLKANLNNYLGIYLELETRKKNWSITRQSTRLVTWCIHATIVAMETYCGL
jgi:hypothetical protein